MKLSGFKSRFCIVAALLGATFYTSPTQAGVTIVRDAYGVPKITADTDAEMWFAFGFVQARDRLIQLEILKQSAYGRLPTTGLKDSDSKTSRQTRNWRRLHIFPDLRNKLTGELIALRAGDAPSSDIEDALKCFSAGINAFKQVIFQHTPLAGGVCDSGQANLPRIKDRELADFTSLERAFIESTFKGEQIPIPTADVQGDTVTWDKIDSLALFHRSVMDEFSLRNTEMKNLKLLYDLYTAQGGSVAPAVDDAVRAPQIQNAIKLFNSVKWSLHPEAKTTIPVPNGNPDGWKISAQAKRNLYHTNLSQNGITVPGTAGAPLALNHCNIYNPANLKGIVNQSTTLTAHNTKSSFPLNASNWWVISQPRGDNPAYKNTPDSLLYNGPQISPLDPSSTYQVALQGAHFTFAGNSFVGTLNFWQGRNKRMAFGLTAGNIDVSDIFCVPVTKLNDVWGYGADGARKIFNTIFGDDARGDEFRAVANETGNKRFFGTEPGLDDLYTVAGDGWPVLAIDKKINDDVIPNRGTAYIMRYNWQGLTAGTLDSWLKATQAQSIVAWNTALDQVAGNFNLSAIHQDGTAAYRLTGALPIKTGMNAIDADTDAKDWGYFPDYDPRLPALRSPQVGWPDQDVQLYHKLKHSVNGGNIPNWNQKPFVNMPDGDLDYDSYTPYDRVSLIEKEIRDHDGRWTLDHILEMNGRIQRMDVNWFAYKPFLEKLTEGDQALQGNNRLALNLILSWNGMRGNALTGDNRGLHKGHVLFYHWLEKLNDWFKGQVADGNRQLIGSLGRGQMKMKQPKLSWNFEHDSRSKLTTETSHNIHLGSRIMLQALHAALGPIEGSPAYAYDAHQFKFFGDEGAAAAARGRMTTALIGAITAAKDNQGLTNLTSASSAYLPAGSATFSGLSPTLGLNDAKIGFRPGKILDVKHFRNRGAFNVGVALWADGKVEAANVSSPGIREYRGKPGADKEGSGIEDWTKNQLDLFSNNEYRDMHPLN